MQKSVDYSQAIATRFPEQVIIAIARDKKGMANPITLGWTMITSGQPPMMAISVGKGRYSLEAIRHSREFVISLPSDKMAEATLFFGTRSGRELDKLKESGIKTEPAKDINSVLLSDAAANFECVLRSETETGDHYIFVGEVVASHINKESQKRLYTTGTGYQLGGV